MPYIEGSGGTSLYVKDWGRGRPVVLVHGWPLNADSWEYQAVPLVEAGYRVVAYDRRGFGRSEQPWDGYDYDTLSDDLQRVMSALDLQDVALVGFSMAGGEVARYMSRHDGERVRQAALIGSVAPFLLKTADHPEGVDDSVFEGIKEAIRADRPAFFRSFFRDFYGMGPLGAGVDAALRTLTGQEEGGASEQILEWSWGMAMLASPRATLACVDAFGKTDLRPDMAAFRIPTLVIHGSADKTVPMDISGRAAARMIATAAFKEYEGAPHGLLATHARRVTRDLLEFLRG